MDHWELDGPAQEEFAALKPTVQTQLAAFMDAVVIVDPAGYQRRDDERENVPVPLRMLHFGSHLEGLVTFLVYPPDDLVLVVRLQWLGD
jgi:hypothetical protein